MAVIHNNNGKKRTKVQAKDHIPRYSNGAENPTRFWSFFRYGDKVSSRTKCSGLAERERTERLELCHGATQTSESKWSGKEFKLGRSFRFGPYFVDWPKFSPFCYVNYIPALYDRSKSAIRPTTQRPNGQLFGWEFFFYYKRLGEGGFRASPGDSLLSHP